VNTYSGGSWLSTNPVSATISPADGALAFTVSANPSGLAAGDYYGIVTISPTDGIHPAVSISVVLNIIAPNTNVPPLVSPAGLVFLATAGQALNSQSVGITDLASYSVGATLTSAQFPTWLGVSQKSVVVNSGQTGFFAVSVDTSNLAAGVYQGSVSLAFTDTTTQVVDVVLVIAPGAAQSSSARPKSPQPADGTSCTPTQLLPVFTSLSSGFSTPAAWPTAVVVNVVDDCASPVSAGVLTVAFGNGDPPLSLLSLGDGNWSSTWTPSHTESAFAVTATAQLQQPALQGMVQVSGQVPSNPQVPVVSPGGVVSAADYSSSPALGLLVSIFGSALSDSTAGAQSLPLPEQLGGTSVVLGGEELPLLFASGNQINFVVPYDLAPKTQYPLIVQRGTSISVPVTVTVMPADPAILSTNGSGSGQGHIYRVDASGNAALADAQNPAQAGQALVIYCAGLGAVTPTVPAGEGSPPAGPVSNTVATVSVMIGGQPAHVLFSGLAPGFAGLYQVNAVVPSGVTAGDQVPVTLSVAGQNSISSISMAVQ
jgi:adhesin/invasin